jgi:uncharacterized protein
MLIEQFRWLAGVIAAHRGRKIVGRTRLQKTVYLLQRKGLPTDFSYSLHFYGPYSDGINTGLRLVRQLGLVKEEMRPGPESEYYVYQATQEAELPQLAAYASDLEQIQAAGDVPLELAATYDSFREMGYPHPEALERLRQKKGAKCTPDNETQALNLLRGLGLPVDA